MGLFDCGILRPGSIRVDDGSEVDLGLMPIYYNYDYNTLIEALQDKGKPVQVPACILQS